MTADTAYRVHPTRADATAFLAARWAEECDRWPTMRDDIPLRLYVSRNIAATLRVVRWADR